MFIIFPLEPFLKIFMLVEKAVIYQNIYSKLAKLARHHDTNPHKIF
jgi:hypothetical protein